MGQKIDMTTPTMPHDTIQGILAVQADYSSKVLIVDDEPDIVEEVIEQLEDEGINCLSANSAKTALEMVMADPEINVVVTDIRMPGMDGLEMARQIKSTAMADRDIFVIVVTGHAGMKEAIEALQLGAEDFLTKPLSPDHLLHSVRRAGEMVHLRQSERSFNKRLEAEVARKTAELNQALQKLSTASQIKDQFMSTMGHELRTPLNAINGFAGFLQEKLQDHPDKSIHEYLDHIIDSGNRLSGTIENILEFSEALSGERKAHMDEIIITDVLENISGQYAPMAKEKNISIRIDDLAQNQIINADHAMLARALGCLLDNAIKFSSDNTEITIGAKSGDNTTSIFVSDQGCGMSADDIVIAKKPLMQVDGGLTRQAEGTGIGLSLAILLAELQGGNLEIESTPDVGTSVSISLPANGTSEDAVE